MSAPATQKANIVACSLRTVEPIGAEPASAIDPPRPRAATLRRSGAETVGGPRYRSPVTRGGR